MNEEANPDDSSDVVLQHCRSLQRLLELLPKPSPPRDEILELLKKNVQIFAAFIELGTQSPINDVPLNQENHENLDLDESQNKNEVPLCPLANDEKPSKIDSNLQAAGELCASMIHSNKDKFIPKSKRGHSKFSRVLRLSPFVDSCTSSLSWSPAAMADRKVAQEQLRYFAEKYRELYGLDPASLLPFQPADRYPSKYIVAEHTFSNGEVSNAAFVGNVLMLGDGYIFGVASYLVHNRSYSLDPTLYNKTLSISQLSEAVTRFSRLPERVLLSIGSSDAHEKCDKEVVRRQYISLLQKLNSQGVRKLHVLPITTFPNMSDYYEHVFAMVAENWSKTFGGDYTFEYNLIQSIRDSFSQPRIDQDDFLILSSKKWRIIVDAIRMKFDPSATR